jgi:uncharacterized phage-associated protein
MSYSALAVANTFISMGKSDKIRGLTPMKLQKLLFFSQLLYLVKKDEKLIDAEFDRWKFGPVIPAIYELFSVYGRDSIDQQAGVLVGDGDELVLRAPVVDSGDNETIKFLGLIAKRLGRYDAISLSNLSHAKGTAWAIGDPGTTITTEDLKNDVFFKRAKAKKMTEAPV